MDLLVLKLPEYENHIFSSWSVYMYVCYQNNLKTNCSRNIKFDILHLYPVQMLLKTFYKDRTKTLCTGAHKRILICYSLCTEFRAREFSYNLDCGKYNESHIYVCHGQKHHVNCRIWNELHARLIDKVTQKYSDM